MPASRLNTLAVSLTLFSGVTALIAHECLLMPDGKTVTVRFFNVGQGDSALITGPHGQQMMIDAGPDMRALEELGKAMPFFDRSIDTLVLSHPHLDHVAVFPEILDRYNIGQVIISGAAYDNGPYQEFLSLIREKHIPILLPVPGKVLDLGDGMMMHLLWPPPIYFGKTLKSIHDSNVVFKLQYGDDSVLFVGDLETEMEKELLDEKMDLAADVLKVGHHGSRTSSSSGFLLAVHPSLAIVSVAAKNSYGLPDEDVLARLTHFGIPYKTTMSGSILWRMDGKDGP